MDVMKPLLGRPLLTAAEFERMGSVLDPCELWDGTIAVHEPSAPYGDAVSAVLIGLFRVRVAADRSGWVFGSSAGFQVGSNPDRVLSPDLAFIHRDRLATLPRRGFYKMTPDLVAEVRSPSDTWAYTLERGGIWIAHGAKVVWLIDPEPRVACVFRPVEAPVEVGPGGVLSAEPVLPGFAIAMKDVFEALD